MSLVKPDSKLHNHYDRDDHRSDFDNHNYDRDDHHCDFDDHKHDCDDNRCDFDDHNFDRDDHQDVGHHDFYVDQRPDYHFLVLLDSKCPKK